MCCYFPCQKFPPCIASRRKNRHSTQRKAQSLSLFCFCVPCSKREWLSELRCWWWAFCFLIEPPAFSILLCVGPAFPGRMDGSREVGCLFLHLKNGEWMWELGEGTGHNLCDVTSRYDCCQVLPPFLAWWFYYYLILHPLLCTQKNKLARFVKHLVELLPFLAHMTIS